jgi:phage shock protein A
VSGNLKSLQQQVEEIQSLIAEANQTLAQATYALNTLLDRLEEEDSDERRWARPRGPV